MIDTYIYTEDSALECLIAVFGGLQDGAVKYSDLTNWCDQTCHIFNLQMFRGDHFFIHNLKLPFLETLSQHLQTVINRLKSVN
jgi:medium-chain acyl-[acyl-carrier-protein] hydrolase